MEDAARVVRSNRCDSELLNPARVEDDDERARRLIALRRRTSCSLLEIFFACTMKPLIAFILLCSTLQPVTAASSATGDLYISVSLTKIERSKDSNSRKTNITVSGNKIAYERSYGGARRNRTEPVRKEYKITDEEIKRLLKVVRDQDLLTSDSLEYTATGGGFLYFEISLDVRAWGKQSRIEISGPSKAAGVRDEKLYKKTNALLEEIFRIINAQDNEIRHDNHQVIAGSQ